MNEASQGVRNGVRDSRFEKATRGRVRTPKASRNEKSHLKFSHEVLWSAMRLRIALGRLAKGAKGE